jgi:AAA+ ATPase superfamily predicted ATPase
MSFKIVRWWVKEIEATTDPDMNEEKYDSADWDNVESIDTMLLREIVDKTLADNPEWQDLRGMSNEYQNE